jgi:hypothetical protein
MSYKGRFVPKNYKKYKGDPTNVIFRSLLERKFMIYCDTNDYILQWSSEEIIVPYYSPVDKKWHRYFPDFYIKYRDKSGQICESLIEIKPKIQTSAPQVKTTPKGRPTSRFLREAITWEVNQAKWKAAQEYCLDRKWEFKIITEKELR